MARQFEERIRLSATARFQVLGLGYEFDAATFELRRVAKVARNISRAQQPCSDIR